MDRPYILTLLAIALFGAGCPSPAPPDMAALPDMDMSRDVADVSDAGKDMASPDMVQDIVEDMDAEPDSSVMPERLRLATWNIHYLDTPEEAEKAPRTTEDYERLIKYVGRLNADVIALQEVHGEAGAHTIFPSDDWEVFCEDRNSRQNVCVAVRTASGWSVEQHPDVEALNIGGGNLRRGVDVTLHKDGLTSLRLLAVHMKSNCFFGDSLGGCSTFFSQLEPLEAWIDARASEEVPYLVLGDFNRFMTDDDVAWQQLDDSEPANADLTRSIQTDNTPCWDSMFSNYIDHIMLDPITASWLQGSEQMVFDETNFEMYYEVLSDHCPLWADLEVPPK